MAYPSQRIYDKRNIDNLDIYSKKIRNHYLRLINEVARLTPFITLNSNEEFFFRNNPTVNAIVNDLIKELYDNVYTDTVAGINGNWELAVEKHNNLAKWVFGKSINDLPKQYINKYFSTNSAAKRTFVARKTDGLGLSDRVWRNSKQAKKQLELALELAVGKGQSANILATDLKKYLNEPERLYRRVRDEKGVLRLSKAAKDYNPGQGISRSSYKNAQRLARNEINFSYEESQREKRGQQDFIVGTRIRVSPSHNPIHDKGGISCYDLQGDYPKGFNFSSKWHVNCKCMSLSILKTRDELDKDIDLILDGKEPKTVSKNEVKENPKSYDNYIKDNSDLWANWKNKPRFLVNY